MAAPDLHKFERDLQNRPGPGSNAPPRTIRAKDLDENFKKVTVVRQSILPVGVQSDYEMRYKKDGSEIIFRAADFDICENGVPVKYRLLGQRKA